MSTYACSDLHGRFDLFKFIQDFLQPNDKLYIIGDVFDRGPDGWEIYKAIKEDPRITLLMGNHEKLAARGLIDRMVRPPLGDWEYSLWVDYNGGYPTFDAICAEYPNEKFHELIIELNSLPYSAKYINQDGIVITLVHSGSMSVRDEDKIWDREHLNETKWKGKDYEMIVHGHTPIELIIDDWRKSGNPLLQDVKDYEEGSALWYCDNHKVCLDTGACWTGKIVVLNLDTFDEHIFEGEAKNG